MAICSPGDIATVGANSWKYATTSSSKEVDDRAVERPRLGQQCRQDVGGGEALLAAGLDLHVEDPVRVGLDDVRERGDGEVLGGVAGRRLFSPVRMAR